MYWGDFSYLLALQRHGSYNRAARELAVTHTTVTRHVQALEQRYGTKLVEPSPDGVVLTAAGEMVVRTARDLEGQIFALERAVMGEDARLRGTLRVTLSDLMAEQHVADLVLFRQAYPDIELDISVDNQARSLARREADVALRVTNKPPDNLVGRRVLRHEYAIFASPGLYKQYARAGDLADYPWIVFAPSLGARKMERWMRTSVPDAHIAARVDSGVMMLRAVQQGMGVAFLPCLVGDSDPGLVRFGDIEPGFGIDSWLLTPRELRRNARVRAFIDHMQDAMQPLSELSRGLKPRSKRRRR